jgi:hypothetical protein
MNLFDHDTPDNDDTSLQERANRILEGKVRLKQEWGKTSGEWVFEPKDHDTTIKLAPKFSRSSASYAGKKLEATISHSGRKGWQVIELKIL